MSDYDVYESEMPKSTFSDSDIERLLSGNAPADEGLARLAPLVEGLRTIHSSLPSEEEVAVFSVEAASLVRSTRPHGLVSGAAEKRVSQPRRFNLGLKRRLATFSTAGILLAGMTGIAVASNGAAPGDVLYGLDRALEAVGVANGAAVERIAEAQALFASGQVAEAVTHAAEAAEDIEELGADEAVDALLETADRLRSNENGSDHAVDVRSRVAAMLEYIATTEDTGRDFGQGVADMARGISGADVEPESADPVEDEAETGEDSGPPDSLPEPADSRPGRP